MLDVINRYAHGFVAIPVILVCQKRGLFEQLKSRGQMNLEQMVDHLDANSGHFQVALRLLCSLGWLSQDADVYTLTEEGEGYCHIPQEILELFQFPMESYLLSSQGGELRKWVDYSRQRWCESTPLMADLLDGVLLIPILLVIYKHKTTLVETKKLLFSTLSPKVCGELTELFINKAWAVAEKDHLSLTSVGQFMLDRTLNMGVTASYKPMLLHMSELLFGSHHAELQRHEQGQETHIDRTLNVIASGFQHNKYFAQIDEMITVIFDNLSFETQPKYVADMGCGDGSLLKRIYETICTKSARGKVLAQYPITMLGIDYNQASLIETSRTLSDIPHQVLHGDIGDPEKMVADLVKQGIANPESILHIRSFLDHDRPYIPPTDGSNVSARTRLSYEGVYVDAAGQAILPEAAVQSLTEHLKRWAAIPSQYGLIILEVHCLDASTANTFLSESESLHFDACQAFSLQHLVEADVFIMAAAEAGLFTKPAFLKYYPKTFPFTRITLNWFKKRPYIIRHARLTDLPFLLELETIWAEPLRVSETIIKQRLVRFPAGQCVLEMDNRIVGVVYSQRIADTQVLKQATYAGIPSLHTPKGSVIQLITINVLSEMQHLGLGDQLLEFMLQYCTVKNGIERIAGVTRCKNYTQQHEPMAVYIQQKNEQGQYIDPILRFHHNHGAQIKSIVHDYRPKDVDNEGHGVLIEYDIHHRTTGAKSLSIDKNSSLNPLTVIENSIRSIMGHDRLVTYSSKFSLQEMGMDSLDLLELKILLCRHFEVELEPTFFFQYSTPQAIVRYLQGETNPKQQINRMKPTWTKRKSFSKKKKSHQTAQQPPLSVENDAIAIIGMACRLPNGIDSLEDYWSLLHDGKSAITEVPKTRWDNALYYDPEPKKQGKLCANAGGFLKDIDQFDPSFFRITPREAISLDPQQRLLLELNWEALEHAGLSAENLAGSQTGLFTGISSHDYETLQLKQETAKTCDFYFSTGNSASTAVGRLAYFFDFHGPAIAVDTACSSSLVAVHSACQSLRTKECDLALASGVNLLLTPEHNIAFSSAGLLAPDGRCKTFDANADGYVFSEGCAAIVLKRLPQALDDNDNILGIIRHSAVNQDGRSNGLTAPNGDAQEALIRQTLSVGIKPSEVSYVETHGTGTPLGDTIEVKALENVYGEDRANDNPLIIGSVKTNIGHTEAVSGLAGLIKIVLSMQNHCIPKHLNFQKLDPNIALDQIPAIIPVENMPWKRTKKARLAGINTFSFSGTNAHVILEEPPVATTDEDEIERSAHLLTLSAQNKKALQELVQRYISYFNVNPQVSLAETCFTTQVGRTHFEHRLAVVTDSMQNLQQQLATFVADQPTMQVFSGIAPSSQSPKIAFLFTGQGSQYIGMGRELYETQAIYRTVIDQCDEILRPVLDKSLLDILYPDASDESLINQTIYLQPVLFSLEYALAQLWLSWGIQPDYVLGHSIGEYVAACIAGVFSLADGLKLIAERGRLMQSTESGDMVALSLDQAAVKEIINAYPKEVSIAVINGPQNVVIAGRKAVLNSIVKTLPDEVRVTKLIVSHAFHSPLMKPILAEFEQFAAENITFSKPHLGVGLVSNVTGQLEDILMTEPNYWRRQIRETVRFSDGLYALQKQGVDIFVEIGPKPVLSSMGQRYLSKEKLWLASLQPEFGDWQTLSQSLAKLYIQGVSINWEALEPDSDYRRLVLPTYPFQRQRYWIHESEPVQPIQVQQSKAPASLVEENQSILNRLAAVNSAAQRKLLLHFVQDKIRKIMRLDSQQDLPTKKSLRELGFDSFMSTELVCQLDHELNIRIPVERLIRADNIYNLTTILLDDLRQESGIEAAFPSKNGIDDSDDFHSASREIPQIHAIVTEQIGRKVRIEGRWVYDFASCNYLGLDLQPEVMETILPAIKKWGVHPSWTRAVASPAIYDELEQALANLVGAPSVLVFPAITLLHAGVLPVLAGYDGIIFKDIAAHRSVHEGCLLAQSNGATFIEFKHNDVEDLRQKLAQYPYEKTKIIAIDGVYSMSGAYPPLPELAHLAKEYNAWVYMDDAHGIGIIGEKPTPEMPYGHKGNGVVKHFGLDYARDRLIYVSGLSKSYSSFGAFITCIDEEMRNRFKTASTFIFSGPSPVASLASAIAGIKLNQRDGEKWRQQVYKLTYKLVTTAKAMGFEVVNDNFFPIVGVIIGKTSHVVTACQILWKYGILITPALFPIVAMDRGQLRFSITAANTEEQIDQVLASLLTVRQMLKG